MAEGPRLQGWRARHARRTKSRRQADDAFGLCIIATRREQMTVFGDLKKYGCPCPASAALQNYPRQAAAQR